MPTEHYKSERPKKYNPQNTPAAVLKSTFVIRLKEYQKIWADIQSSKMDTPEQHYIVQGVRGAGKTTLLTRLAIEVEESPQLSSRLMAIQFKEEEYGINSLFSFWAQVGEDLEEHHQHGSLFSGLAEQIECVDGDENNEAEVAFKLIDKRLTQHSKKIVLFIDNIAELFETFDDEESALLREVLSQNTNIRIVGGSATSLEAFFDHSAPFYQFFKIITLKALTKKETTNLLTAIGVAAGVTEAEKINRVIKQEPEKIESIRRLTGGIPRIIMLLFDILAEGPRGSTFQYLEETLDMASPIYKHRMEDLSPQQKPIIHAMAKRWEAISAKEIAEKTRISSKNVSAQLSQLEKQWIIEKVPTNTKNKLYRLQERFFNIWYLMRYGRRHDKNRMRYLSDFIELWCTPDEIKRRVKQLGKSLAKNSEGEDYLPGTVAYATALMGCSSIGIEEKEALYHQAASFLDEGGHKDLLKNLPAVSGDEYYTLAVDYYKNGDLNKAVEYFEKLYKQGTVGAIFAAGILSHVQGDYPKAEAFLLKAIESGDDRACLNLGGMYRHDLKDYSKAEAFYLKAIESGNDGAYLNLGTMYHDDLKNYPKAEAFYIKAIEFGIDGALNSIAWHYFETIDNSKREAALNYAQESIAVESSIHSLHTLSSIALWNNDIELSSDAINKIFNENEWVANEWIKLEMVELLLLFIAKGQTNLVDGWFQKYQLKDALLPLYYVLMYYLKDRYPNEYLRMGSEIQETVDEMLAKVEELKKRYC